MASDTTARRSARPSSGAGADPRVPPGDDRPDATRGTAGQVAMRDRFNRIADRTTSALGSFWALLASVLVVVVWALTGPIFHFSDTWQLFINTATTVVTFWMVFVIQNSQNRDSKAVHLKLDELIRAVEGARNAFITLENEPEDVVSEKAEELAQIANVAGDHDEVNVTAAQRSLDDTSVKAARAARRGVGADRRVGARQANGDDVEGRRDTGKTGSS